MTSPNFDTVRSSVITAINAGVKMAEAGNAETERGEQVIANAIMTFAQSEPKLDFGNSIERIFTSDMLDKSGFVLLRGHDHSVFTKDNRKDLVNALVNELCPHAKWGKKDIQLHGEQKAAEHNGERDTWVRRFKRGFDVAGLLVQISEDVSFDPKAKAFSMPWAALNQGNQRLACDRQGSVLLDGKAPIVLMTKQNKKGDDTLFRFKPTIASLFTMFKSTSESSGAAGGVTLSAALKLLSDQGDKLITMELSSDLQAMVDTITNMLIKRREYVATKEHPEAKAA